ncbi:MAG TPA: hypothetical protein VHM00_09745 [Caldimonas sp.]|nr:hypothetical protein [Caldimonas sp.]HEX2541350.1 hypothetical protein [Caldimonas sp.]
MYRYVFYDWLFRDARSGSALERAAALRHNRSSARWLPTYLRRWSIAAALLVAAEAWAEHSLSSIGLAAVLAVALVLVVVFIVVTTVCWAGLRSPRRSG